MNVDTKLGGHYTVSVNFADAAEVADKVTVFLSEAKIPLGVGLIGLMMVLALQSSPDDDPSPEKIGKMVQDMSEFVGAYWGGGGDGN